MNFLKVRETIGYDMKSCRTIVSFDLTNEKGKPHLDITCEITAREISQHNLYKEENVFPALQLLMREMTDKGLYSKDLITLELSPDRESRNLNIPEYVLYDLAKFSRWYTMMRFFIRN